MRPFLLLILNSLFLSCSYLRTTRTLLPDSSECQYLEYKNFNSRYNNLFKSYVVSADGSKLIITYPVRPFNALTFGPPFIPLIPNPFLLWSNKPVYDSHFFVDISSDSYYLNPETDPSKLIEFFANGKNIITPDSVFKIEKLSVGLPNGITPHFIRHSPFQPTDSTQTFRFYFGKINCKKVKTLEIRHNHNLLLRAKKKRKWLYQPFVFDN